MQCWGCERRYLGVRLWLNIYRVGWMAEDVWGCDWNSDLLADGPFTTRQTTDMDLKPRIVQPIKIVAALPVAQKTTDFKFHSRHSPHTVNDERSVSGTLINGKLQRRILSRVEREGKQPGICRNKLTLQANTVLSPTCRLFMFTWICPYHKAKTQSPLTGSFEDAGCQMAYSYAIFGQVGSPGFGYDV